MNDQLGDKENEQVNEDEHWTKCEQNVNLRLPTPFKLIGHEIENLNRVTVTASSSNSSHATDLKIYKNISKIIYV